MRPPHRQSHVTLLQAPPIGPVRSVDAVIVPAGRPAHYLESSARLAVELNSALLVMCGPGGADPLTFAEIACSKFPHLDWYAIQVSERDRHPLLPRSAFPDELSQDWRHGALSVKRNLGLLIARLMRWSTVFLVDDDIVELVAQRIRTAAAGLASAAAVGLTVDDFPDNSVVCHANRFAGSAQGVFVGACALVLDTSEPFGFFPNIYNEDWLFLYDSVAAGRVARIDRVTQLPYQPFGDAARARAEEFGDLVAEGLMSGLQAGYPATPPTSLGYWADFIQTRRRFIDDIVGRISGGCANADDASVLKSLDAGASRLADITAESCAEFIGRWRADLPSWFSMVAGLPAVADVGTAISYLGLDSIDRRATRQC